MCYGSRVSFCLYHQDLGRNYDSAAAFSSIPPQVLLALSLLALRVTSNGILRCGLWRLVKIGWPSDSTVRSDSIRTSRVTDPLSGPKLRPCHRSQARVPNSKSVTTFKVS
jgi:hypothetical protein